MTWTQEQIEMLRKLRREGHSFGEISKRVKMSRNACIGKAARLGLTHITNAPTRKRPPAQKMQAWNPVDPHNADHAIDTRDLAILNAMAAGRQPSAIAREFKATEDRVRELWRIRELQDPIGEDA